MLSKAQFNFSKTFQHKLLLRQSHSRLFSKELNAGIFSIRFIRFIQSNRLN